MAWWGPYSIFPLKTVPLKNENIIHNAQFQYPFPGTIPILYETPHISSCISQVLQVRSARVLTPSCWTGHVAKLLRSLVFQDGILTSVDVSGHGAGDINNDHLMGMTMALYQCLYQWPPDSHDYAIWILSMIMPSDGHCQWLCHLNILIMSMAFNGYFEALKFEVPTISIFEGPEIQIMQSMQSRGISWVYRADSCGKM